MGTLFVAAGGGGDAVAILLAQRLLAPGESGPPAIATCAWERLIIDPVPGPRGRNGFSGLHDHPGVSEVLADSATVPAGCSMLPRFVRDVGSRVFLLDLGAGVRGMAEQLAAAADVAAADRIVLVDSGGDAVATGGESSLKSPLADAMGVAASLETGLPVELAVVGPGSDGELTEREVIDRLRAMGAQRLGDVASRDAARVSEVMQWHPTEASAIVSAAAQGRRPRVAMRRGDTPFSVTENTAGLWVVEPTQDVLPLTSAVASSRSLEEAGALMAKFSVNELDYERRKAAQAPTDRHGRLGDLVRDMEAGATHVTLRRAWELTGEPRPAGTHGGVTLQYDLPGLFRVLPAA